jgi:archaeal type IV pilus assembly protein PilA
VEGKKYRELGENCQAISEVIGQVLMIAIVVLAFSSIAVVIFSDVVVNPPHTPHTDLQASMQPGDSNSNYTLCVLHIGGEAIDLKNAKIAYLNASRQTDYFTNLEDVSFTLEGYESENGNLMLGDFIKFDIPKNNLTITDYGTIDMYFVYTPSQQVIQKFTFYV